jgi:hypothetical protein
MAVAMGGYLQDPKPVSVKVSSQFIIVDEMDVFPS